MTEFLIRIWVKDYDQVEQPEVRGRYGVLSGVIGIVLNLLLFAGKLTAGMITASIAITADAFNNLSDAGSSIITLIGFKMAVRPADTAHPFGHGRIEYIAGFIMSLLILLMGFELLRVSFDKILHPVETSFTLVSLIILLAAILIKLWMAYFNRKLSRRIDSVAMKATAVDSLSDAVATTVVLIGIGISHFTELLLDGYLGLLVSLFILYAGFNAARDTLNPLLGQPPSNEQVEGIYATVMAHSLVSGMHDLLVHDYGPGRVSISLHAEVPHNHDIMELHDLIDCIEDELRIQFNAVVTIHMDPVALNDERTMSLRRQIAQRVKEIDPALSIHDFRMVPGPTHTNLLFDAVVPAGFHLSDQVVAERIQLLVKTMDPNFQAVVQIDQSYVR